MSIVALALRLCAVRALQSAGTIAERRIYDSAILPLDQLTNEEPLPFVSISTEDENTTPEGTDINNGSRTIDLLIEIAITQVVEIPVADDDGRFTGERDLAIAVVNSDAALELSIAILTRQITSCLFGRGGGLWGVAFRKLASPVQSIKSRRGIPVKDGTRYAARQTAFTIHPIAEPPLVGGILSGTPLAAFFAALDAEADSDEVLFSIRKILRSAIDGEPIGWSDVYSPDAVNAGYSDATGEGLGFTPLPVGEGNAPLAEVTVNPAGSDPWVMTTEGGLEQFPPDPDE